MNKNSDYGYLAKMFFDLFWNDEKHKVHNQAIIKCCFGMITNTNLRKDVFIVASWIHDMGKVIDKKTHHIKSLNLFNSFIKKHNIEDEELINLVRDCILNHRTGGTPKTLYGQIFQLADKVALYDKNWIEWKSLEK